MAVLVFKTNLSDPVVLPKIKPKLDQLAGYGQWNFDFTDCDNILRIAAPHVTPHQAIELLNNCGFDCDELPD